MKIQLKNVVFNENQSEETLAFTADVAINGVIVLYASNDGKGGCTCYNPYPSKRHDNRKTMLEAEEYCKTLAPRVFPATQYSNEFSVPMNLEMKIEQLFDEWLLEYDTMKLVKIHQTKSIVYGKIGGTLKTVSLGVSLSQLAKNNEGKLKALILNVQNNLNEGESILNTNIKRFL